jgi:uncharacterized protein YbjQ (UPF0145 family)
MITTIHALRGVQMLDPQQILAVTTEHVAGFKVTKTLGEVFGCTSRSRNMFSNMGAGFKAMVGGELEAFTKLIEETRGEAMYRMKANASAMGANAVIMMRFDNESMAQTAGGTVAYGTAVVLEPENPAA